MTKQDFYRLVCVHNARQAGLLGIVAWISAYTVSLILSRVISSLYLDGSFEALLAVFVVLATGLNLMMRSNCEGPRKLWYAVCVAGIICVGLYLSGEALRIQSLRQQAERIDQRVSEMVSNCPGAVFASTQSGEIRAVNAGACDLTGYSSEELVGASLDAIMTKGDAGNRIAWREQSAVVMHDQGSPGWVMALEEISVKTKSGELLPSKFYVFGLRHSVFGAFPDDVQFVSIIVNE